MNNVFDMKYNWFAYAPLKKPDTHSDSEESDDDDFLWSTDPSDWPSYYMEKADHDWEHCYDCPEETPDGKWKGNYGEYSCKICRNCYCDWCATEHERTVVEEHRRLLWDDECEIEDCPICLFEEHAQHANAWDIEVKIQRCVFCKQQRNLDRQALKASVQSKAAARRKCQNEKRLARLVEEIAPHLEGKSAAEASLAKLAKLVNDPIK